MKNGTPSILCGKDKTGSTVYTLTYGNFALQSSIKIGSRTLASYGYSEDGNHDLTSLDYGNRGGIEYGYSYDANEKANPLRYRGYVYDEETGLYYVSSRYYDPEIGRWISPDNVVAGVGQSVQGYNLYTYCFNNPVNMDDPDGNWPKWVQKIGNTVKETVFKVVNTIKSVVNKVKQDVKNFNIKNTSEKKVLSSNYVSAYKGKVVIRTNLERSGSYGALFISRKASERSAPEDEVRHEYGHTKQLDQLGLVKYTMCIGMPSMFEWGSDSVYYRRPWEITADIYGGVQSRSYPEYEAAGFEYLENSKRWGPLVWLTID